MSNQATTGADVYEVFARKSRGEPLRHIGALNAPDDDLAKVYAYSKYDEEKWFDLWVVPRDRLLEVFRRTEPAGRTGGGAGDVAPQTAGGDPSAGDAAAAGEGGGS